jgi:ribonuclease HI
MIRKVNAYYSGDCVGPDGAMAYGYIVFVDGKRIADGSDYFPPDKGNTKAAATFAAIAAALSYLVAQDMKNDQVRMYGDDMHAVNLMNGRWKPKGNKVGWYGSSKELAEWFVDLNFTAITRVENGPARELVEDMFKQNGVELPRPVETIL